MVILGQAADMQSTQRWGITAVAAVAVAGMVALVVTDHDKQDTKSGASSPPATVVPSGSPGTGGPESAGPPSWSPTEPVVPAGVWLSWAYLDSPSGQMRHGGGAGTTITASMIKPAVAAEYLHRHGRDPAGDRHITAALVDSDNQATEWLYANIGRDAGIRHVLSACAMIDSRTRPGWWSMTRVTAVDAARMGGCLRQAGVTNAEHAQWLITQMGAVRGLGRFGIIAARPTAGGRPLAIKNGWLLEGGQWHINCLAIGPWWSAAVLTRYPADRGMAYGQNLCAQAALAVIPPDQPASPEPIASTDPVG